MFIQIPLNIDTDQPEMKTVVVLVLAVLTHVNGSVLFNRGQYVCCGPDDVWEADEGFMIGSNAGGGTLTEGRVRLSYDNTNQKVNMDGESYSGGKVTKFRILQFFQQKLQYVIGEGSCVKQPITYDFIPSCIPVNATKVSSSFYGSPDRLFKVDVYKTHLMGLSAYITANPDPVDPNTCMPVAEVIYGQVGTAGQMENIAFTNYRKGLNDPTVFDVPDICKHTAGLKQPDVLTVRRLRRSVFA